MRLAARGWKSTVKDVKEGARDLGNDVAAAVDAPASPFSAIGVKSQDFCCKKMGNTCKAVGEVLPPH